MKLEEIVALSVKHNVSDLHLCNSALCQVMRNIVHIPRMSYEAGRNRSP